MPGGTSKDYPVISGVPQETVFGSLLFLIMIADIDKHVFASKLISFMDDTRLNSGVGDNLQFNQDTVYDWVTTNTFHFLTFFFI